MAGSNSGSFSVATTIFVSLAICAVISYGIFYYFKQRLSVIEKSQMEQARIMQSLISHGIHAQSQQQQMQQHPHGQMCHKEVTITQSGLIEVSSDDESERCESESSAESSDSESSESNTESDSEESKSDKWSIGDEIHQPDSYHQEFEENFKKNVLLGTIHIDNRYLIDSITITTVTDDSVENTAAVEEDADSASNKKIISLNQSALGNDVDANESDDESSSSSSDEETQDKPNVKDLDLDLKIGYKPKKEPLHLNYANMSVPALRQVAKERGLGGEDAELNKLKKKDLLQLLQ